MEMQTLKHTGLCCQKNSFLCRPEIYAFPAISMHIFELLENVSKIWKDVPSFNYILNILQSRYVPTYFKKIMHGNKHTITTYLLCAQ